VHNQTKEYAGEETKMKKTVSWINHKGKDILFLDFKDTTEEEHLAGLKKSLDEIKKHRNETVLLLLDNRNTVTSREVTKQVGAVLDEVNQLGIKVVNCTVGVGGLKKTIIRLIKKEGFHFSDTIEEAVELLARQK
jgi:CO dehydrogenase/acetyl-CoA synthase gamma subunit (corrinoid Fe-S protein)